jgi:hypothetical protein
VDSQSACPCPCPVPAPGIRICKHLTTQMQGLVLERWELSHPPAVVPWKYALVRVPAGAADFAAGPLYRLRRLYLDGL